MSFLHGVYSREEATAVLAVKKASSALPFVVGTAPVHTVPGDTHVNEIVKLESWQDVIDTYGYVHDFARYSLIEFLYSQFRVFGYGPVLAVNVFDPSALSGDETTTGVALVAGVGTLELAGAFLVEVNIDAEGAESYVEGDDYTLSYDTSGYPVITRIAEGAIPSESSTVYVVTKTIPEALCGASDQAVVTGLDQIDNAFARLGDVPSLILAPGFSQDPTVAAAMVAKCEFGGGWFAYALTDIPSDEVGGADAVSEVAAWKSANGYTDENQEALWPKVAIDEDVFHLSTIFAGILAQVDYANGDVPYVSGSNYQLPITGAQLVGGDSVWLTDVVANDYLNANGVTTVINLGSRGWVTWGNRTAAYPGTTDPKDMWRSFRRMLIWLKNTCRLTLMQKVDQPGNLRQIEAIINTLQIFLNGLSAAGALIGQPKVEFRREDNPTTDLLDGKYYLRISVTPPTAMEAITMTWSIDVTQLETLFEGGA